MARINAEPDEEIAELYWQAMDADPVQTAEIVPDRPPSQI